MSDDNPRQEAATANDLSRHAATIDDIEYSLSVEEALARYEAAGLPRTPRTIQRYCAKGHHLKAHLVETPFGDKFLINPESVDTHIAYIKEVQPVATSRDLSRHVATTVAAENEDRDSREGGAISTDERRQAATAEEVSSPIAADTRVIGLLESDNQFLREQIAVKDGQIKEMTERARETNHLIAGLQRLLPMLTAGDRSHDFGDATGPR